jgi:hypothetical protein
MTEGNAREKLLHAVAAALQRGNSLRVIQHLAQYGIGIQMPLVHDVSELEIPDDLSEEQLLAAAAELLLTPVDVIVW